MTTIPDAIKILGIPNRLQCVIPFLLFCVDTIDPTDSASVLVFLSDPVVPGKDVYFL